MHSFVGHAQHKGRIEKRIQGTTPNVAPVVSPPDDNINQRPEGPGGWLGGSATAETSLASRCRQTEKDACIQNTLKKDKQDN